MLHSGRGLRIAFFGAMSPMAQEVMRQLEENAFPVERLHLYDIMEKDGAITEFSGEAVVVTQPDKESAGTADLSFICGDDDPRSGEYLEWISARDGVVLDLVGASRHREGVPVVNCDVNPDVIDQGAKLMAAPHPVAHPLSTILFRLNRAFGVKDACVTAHRPVSDFGKAGVDELHQQTIGLLTFAEVPKEIFGRQVAFNLLPLSLQGEEGEVIEAIVREDVLRVISSETMGLSLRVIQAPIFHGHCYSIRVELGPEATPVRIEEALELQGVIRISQEDDGLSPAELASEPGIWIADIAPDAGRPGSYWIWAISDGMRSGTASNAARLAERLLGTVA
jgi:aspartate-semialdehyde dehydrogenase